MRAIVLCTFSLFTLAACSSSYDAPEMPNRNTLLVKLDDTQRAALCDDMAATRGGYGASTREGCGSSEESASTSAPASQAACVADLSSIGSDCPATVADAIACSDDTADPCASQHPTSCVPLEAAACHWQTSTPITLSLPVVHPNDRCFTPT